MRCREFSAIIHRLSPRRPIPLQQFGDEFTPVSGPCEEILWDNPGRGTALSGDLIKLKNSGGITIEVRRSTRRKMRHDRRPMKEKNSLNGWAQVATDAVVARLGEQSSLTDAEVVSDPREVAGYPGVISESLTMNCRKPAQRAPGDIRCPSHRWG